MIPQEDDYRGTKEPVQAHRLGESPGHYVLSQTTQERRWLIA